MLAKAYSATPCGVDAMFVTVGTASAHNNHR